jgi:ubiquinone/menaquinone biosynthesis C-methylase UbiE
VEETPLMDTSPYSDSVNAHYGRADLGTLIADGLRAAGKDPDNLSYEDLAPVDQFHTRGRDATRELARLTGLRGGEDVLDVGGGIGGAARTLAAEFGCTVTVLDLTAEFCRAGAMLTERTGLSDRVTFKVGDALNMPFSGSSFDLVWTQHSSMNIPDKERLYAEVHRVLRPNGRLAIHEITAGDLQPPHFPTPWASTPDISFLLPTEEMRTLIAQSGFRELAWEDCTPISRDFFRQRAAAIKAGGVPPPVGLHLLLGGTFAEAFLNISRNLDEERIEVVQGVFERL